MRNRGIDASKGALVALMVFCHVLQFFGDSSAYPFQEWIMLFINAVAFPGFVFAYGRGVSLAYLAKPMKDVWRRMLKSALRGYGAFVLSGLAYLVLIEGREFGRATVKSVLLLNVLPGWSEFLISFALYGLIALALFPVLRTLLERKRLFWLVWTLCFASAFLPYSHIRSTHLALFLGGTNFSYFPVLQYMPFFLAGLYVSRHGMRYPWLWMGGSALLTGTGVVYIALQGIPSRFPPSLMWLLLPCLPIVIFHQGSRALTASAERHPWQSAVLSPLESMGRNSLFFLLSSNFTIFSLSHMGILPTFRRSMTFPFNLPTGSTPWALFWTAVLLAGIGFLAMLCGRSRKRP